MSGKLAQLYTSHGRSDLAELSETILSRYPSLGDDVFLKLIESKYALMDRLAVECAARPFVMDITANKEVRDEKKSRPEHERSSRAPAESSGEIEIRVKDHNGKSRVTKVRPGTLMSEIVDWYGPRNGRAFVVDQQTGDRLPSDTSVRKLASAAQLPLDLKIVPK